MTTSGDPMFIISDEKLREIAKQERNLKSDEDSTKYWQLYAEEHVILNNCMQHRQRYIAILEAIAVD